MKKICAEEAGDVQNQEAARRLDAVRSAIEGRFAQAGDTLAETLSLVEELLGALDALMGALDGDTGREAVEALRGTAEDVVALRAAQAERRAGLQALAKKAALLSEGTESTSATLRYMRVFAVNLKISTAGAEAFEGFSEEMLQRLRLGGDKLDQFSQNLMSLQREVGQALSYVAQFVLDCEQNLPAVVGRLNGDAEAILAHNRDVSAHAGEIARLTQQIRSKVASALMGLQIGDTSRQRIEHVMRGLALLDGLAPDERAQAAPMVMRVLHAQMTDLTEAFMAEAPKVSDSLLGLRSDAAQILDLKQRMDQGRDEVFLRTLEASVAEASQMIQRVRTANGRAVRTGAAAASAAESLLADVDAIRSVRSDIQYMALNTSLRCSRMGEAGRPPNVIALELRSSADRLEGIAETMVRNIGSLSSDAGKVSALANDSDVGSVLDTSIQSIREAADRADQLMADLQKRGGELAHAINTLADGASYHVELAQGLIEGCDRLAALAEAGGQADEAAPNAAADEVLAELFKSYTMARERDVHHAIAPAAEPAPQGAQQDDGASEDALLDDVLF